MKRHGRGAGFAFEDPCHFDIRRMNNTTYCIPLQRDRNGKGTAVRGDRRDGKGI